MMETKNLQKWEAAMMKCIRCAYCIERCPVFEDLGWEVDGARGKLVIAYGLMMGDLEPSDYIAEKIYQCTFCKDCVERCSANVSVPDILSAARADLFTDGYTLEAHKQLLKKIKKNGNIFGRKLPHPGRAGTKTVLLGCRLLERTDDSNRYLDILEKLGVKVRTVDETCCGMPFAVLGDQKGFADQQNAFREAMADSDGEFICACTTCAFFIDKKYPDLKQKYIIQEIVDLLPDYKKKIKKLNIKVTYHDPCNVSRGLGMIDEPRWLLSEIGAELVEMDGNRKDTVCCGGGGGVMVTDNPLSMRMARKRVAQAVDTGADYLVTLCPTCELNLKNAARESNVKLEVKNVLDLVYDAL